MAVSRRTLPPRRASSAPLRLALAFGLVGLLLSPGLPGGGTPTHGALPGTVRSLDQVVGPSNCSGRPTVAIDASPSSGVAPLTVNFTAAIAGGCPPFQIEWEFADGLEVEGSTVTHVFQSAGQYPVQARVRDTNGVDTEAVVNITVLGGAGPLTVSIAAAPASGPSPLETTLWANVTGGNATGPFTTSWTFGDGGSGSGSPIAHWYATAGTFVASASVQDPAGETGTGSASLVVGPGGTPAGPNLSLAADLVAGTAPLQVGFTMYSNGVAAADSLAICFGDGTPCTGGPYGWSGSTPYACSHTYNDPGSFTVIATLTNASDAVVAAATVAVTVEATSMVVVVGTATPSSGSSPLTVAFVATVSGGTTPYAVQWVFGDGTVGSSIPGATVGHTYESPGTFAPRVSVVDGSGHWANATVVPVVVQPVPSAPWGSLASWSGRSTGLVVGLALGAAVASVALLGVRSRSRRRRDLKREGEQLVREMEHQK